MARIIKKRKTLKVNKILSFILALSCVMNLFSITVIKSHNLSLNKEIETIVIQNEENERNLQSLEIEVANLASSSNMRECLSTKTKSSFNFDNIVFLGQNVYEE